MREGAVMARAAGADGHEILMRWLCEKVETAIEGLRWKNLVRPVFGTLDVRSLNAMTLFVPGLRVPIVAFDQDMFSLLDGMAELFARIVTRLGDGPSAISWEERLRDCLNEDPSAMRALTSILLSYVARRRVSGAVPPLENLSADVWLSAGGLREGMELFVVSHEYAHILMRHAPVEKSALFRLPASNKDVDVAVWSWVQENIADGIGAVISTHAALPSTRNLPRAYVGGDFFLTCLTLLERAQQVLQGGHVDERLDMKPSGSHPPAFFRRHLLRYQWQERLAEGHYSGGGPPLDPQRSFELARILESIADELWRRLEPGLRSLYNTRARLPGFEAQKE
jgi:hypothetical protein